MTAAIDDQNILERMKLQSPLEHYRLCRSLLLDQNAPKEKIAEVLRYPYAQTYQPSIAASALLTRRLNRNTPPVIPRLLPSGAPFAMIKDRKCKDSLLPIFIADELAGLWMELGLAEEAKKAKAWASQFTGCARKLYTREDAFSPDEAECRSEEGIRADPYLGLLSFSSQETDAAFSLTGYNSALGSMRLSDVSISAFGPQASPLSDPLQFGISHLAAHGAVIIREKERAEIEGWTRCHGCIESWLYLKAELTKPSLDLDLRFSLGAQHRIAFYVQADRCNLESGLLFQPESLQRYQGKIESLFFNDTVRLDCQRTDQELQIIPLAGKNCFWNANYLIAYTCPPGERISFRFSFK